LYNAVKFLYIIIYTECPRIRGHGMHSIIVRAKKATFLNQSNLNLTNKRSRLCMNQERRAHGVRGAWACTLLYYFAKDFMKTMGGGNI